MYFCRRSRVYIRLARGEAKRSSMHSWSQRMVEGMFAMTQGLDTVDFIATHKYGCNASDTIAYVKMLHDRYHKPVWLTEFSCGGATADKQLEFMRQILPVFDTMSDVIPRYAWFAARTNQQTDAQRYATLISNESDTLTTIGQWYNSTV